MPVTVVIARDEHGAPSTREVYASADRYVINEGNLDIAVQGVGTLGTYAGGNWLSVFTDDVVEVITVKPDEDSSDSSDFGMDFDSDSSDSDSSDSDSSDTDSSDTDSSDTETADAASA